jgi:hypothetical protein
MPLCVGAGRSRAQTAKAVGANLNERNRHHRRDGDFFKVSYRARAIDYYRQDNITYDTLHLHDAQSDV